MSFIIEPLGRTVATRRLEVVERKGLGHPDTLCDALADSLSLALCRFYRDHFGVILHHNVDKALLFAGSSTPRFGGGVVNAPLEIFLSGRATGGYKGTKVPIEEIAQETTTSWLAEHMHALDPEQHVRVRCLVRSGSSELTDLFERRLRAGISYANDTSIGVGFWPLTRLEQCVLDVERDLNGKDMKDSHPEYGEDIKVMGVRVDDDIRLTVACALIDTYVRDLDDYCAKTASLVEHIRTTAGEGVSVAVNAGDDIETGQLFLTVTGTSGESGDDGEVGRGNRANGLITPFRPMTLEAVAGKNPVTHVGKLYNLAATSLAKKLVEEIADITDAHCCLVSRIGAPVQDPQVSAVEVHLRDDRPVSDRRDAIEEVMSAELGGIPRLWESLIEAAEPVW
jgi:S-adenosylmethionine synthetase